MSTLEATVSLVNDRMQYRGALRDNPPITMDYIPPLGDGDGYMPLELVLMSLGTCSGSTVAALLRRMGRTVSALDVHAAGVRREQHPTSFDSITLSFKLTSPDAGEEDMQKAIQLSEESICPVWDMLKGRVNISTGFDIIR